MERRTCVDLPYPEVIVDMPSLSDVRCLMNDYAGRESETTAIMQYIFQGYVADELGQEWHRLFIDIAITEMHHHELLGETIIKLGGTPVIGGNRQFWNGSMVNYNKELVQMIELDIISENIAIENYRNTIKCLNNYTIRELIERIILDEELHIKLLKEALIQAKKFKCIK